MAICSPVMGVIYDYFAAPSDADAAALIDRLDPDADDSDIIVLPSSIDPVLHLGKLESLLIHGNTDVDLTHERFGKTLAELDGGAVVVSAVPDELQQAVAAASEDRIDEIAEVWSEIEEFGGGADPTDLAQFLDELADLARMANRTGQLLYCRVCV